MSSPSMVAQDEETKLTAEHEQELVSVMKFLKMKRAVFVRDVKTTFEEVKDSSLAEDTYSASEVESLFNSLGDVMQSNTETELIHLSRMNGLLLRQLFEQAQAWHLHLHCDTAQMENMELLKEFAEFEEEMEKNKLRSQNPLLKSLGTRPSNELLSNELDRLRLENKNLKEQLSGNAESDKETAPPVPTENESVLADEVAKLKAQLKVAEEALEAKINNTVQFKNMKKMLLTKNAEISKLKSICSTYAPEDVLVAEGLAKDALA
eukprot:GCRY01003893.1.p1 GENE.GCRY01003893.1~~GCRY01003893.1.p1  ORF type:complete len:264 (+),score=67.40 GCRY01003893.1:139-930(+)